MAALDLTGLRSHVSIRDVQATYRRRGTPNGRRWWVIAVIVAIYLTGQAVFIGILLPATGLPEDVRRAVYGGFLAFTGLYAAGLMAIIWRNAARLVRVDRMARVNGFVYEDGPAHVAGLTGSIASHSSFTFVADALGGGPGSPLPHSFVAANLGIRPGRSIRRGGLVQVPLDRRTPHIVLENRRVGLLRLTGSNFRADQRLRLEGDFDRTFSLYCPRGYEPDALYIFTPDLMALLLDLAGDCEAELIDGNLVLYRRSPWAWWRPRDVSTLAALVDAVGSKARRQTARYEDWRRTGDEVIASAGRRLRLRPSPGGVLATIVPVAFVAYGAAAWVGLV